MRFRPLARTGLEVSELAFGAMNLGGRTDDVTSRKMLETAIGAGVNLIDTADIYSGGRSEIVVGQVLSSTATRDSVLVATKCGLPTGHDRNSAGGSRRHLVSSCERSLRRLKTDRIDLFQLHRPAFDTDLDQTLSALDDLVRSGKVLCIGTSTHPAWFVMECLAMSARHGWARFVTEQSPYNLLDRRVENELVPLAERHAIGLLPWSPLAGGILAGRYDEPGTATSGSRAEVLPALRDRVTPRALDVARAMRALADQHGLSAAQLSLLWLRDRPAVVAPLIGPRTPEQLWEYLGIADHEPLTKDALSAIDALVPPGTSVSDFHNTSGWTAGSRSLN